MKKNEQQRENTCKTYNWQKENNQNSEWVPTTQHKKYKHLNSKMAMDVNTWVTKPPGQQTDKSVLSLTGDEGNGKQNKEMPFNSPIRVTKSKENDGVASTDSPHFEEL